jgi:rubrerythrin
MPEFASDTERIEYALKNEHDGHTFYQQAAKKASQKLARAAFDLLSREELKHIDLIEGLGRQLGGEGADVEAEELTLKALEKDLVTIYKEASEDPIEDTMDPAAAYEKAIGLEKDVTGTYAAFSRECEDEGARRLFAVLQKEEEHHLSLLEDMHAYLTKPEEWFIDRDGIMLDGG